eukprot:5237070-Pyramimonas_sp.AAC.1
MAALGQARTTDKHVVHHCLQAMMYITSQCQVPSSCGNREVLKFTIEERIRELGRGNLLLSPTPVISSAGEVDWGNGIYCVEWTGDRVTAVAHR